jgi:hypothetical protein
MDGAVAPCSLLMRHLVMLGAQGPAGWAGLVEDGDGLCPGRSRPGQLVIEPPVSIGLSDIFWTVPGQGFPQYLRRDNGDRR